MGNQHVGKPTCGKPTCGKPKPWTPCFLASVAFCRIRRKDYCCKLNGVMALRTKAQMFNACHNITAEMLQNQQRKRRSERVHIHVMFPSPVSTAELSDSGVNDGFIHSHCTEKTEVNGFFDQWKKGLWRFGWKLGCPRGPQGPLKRQPALASCYAVISQLKRSGISTDEWGAVYLYYVWTVKTNSLFHQLHIKLIFG